MNEEALERVRSDWACLPINDGSTNITTLKIIARELKEAGLDLDQNETYELLAPGLTKKIFSEAVAGAYLEQALYYYHHGQRPAGLDLDVDQQVYHQYRSLNYLIKHALPGFDAEGGGESALSTDTDPLKLRELVLIRQAERDGLLLATLQKAAGQCARYSFRDAYWALQKLDQEETVSRAALQEGQSSAIQAVRFIEKAGPFYAPADISVYRMRVRFDKEAVQNCCDEFELRILGMDFKQALGLQDQGYFALQLTTGERRMVLPMKHIQEQLKASGHNIDDPETYRRMGTDIDAFRVAYRREWREALRNPQYKGLAGPECKA